MKTTPFLPFALTAMLALAGCGGSSDSPAPELPAEVIGMGAELAPPADPSAATDPRADLAQLLPPDASTAFPDELMPPA